jgi:hypothetical protein
MTGGAPPISKEKGRGGVLASVLSRVSRGPDLEMGRIRSHSLYFFPFFLFMFLFITFVFEFQISSNQFQIFLKLKITL